MLHPFIRPRLRDVCRAARWPQNATSAGVAPTSDEIVRVAAQAVRNITTSEPLKLDGDQSEPDFLGLEVLVVVLGLLALSWSLGGC